MGGPAASRARYVPAIATWLLAGIVGALAFWIVQVIAGEGTIPQFMGEQITSARGYAPALAPAIGWAVHLGVSLAYAGLFSLVTSLFTGRSFPARAASTLVVALTLGWVTALIAPPAISVTISVLGGQGWASELFPINTETGLPFWNHLLFFGICWLIQMAVPGVYDRAVSRLRPAVRPPTIERRPPARTEERSR